MLKAIGLQIRLRHAAKRVFQRSSDYATFRLSRHHGDGTFHSHDSYSPTPSGRQKAAEYRHSQSTYLCAGPRIFMESPEIISLSNKLKQNKIPEEIPQNNRYKKAAESMNLSFQGSLSAAIFSSKRLQRIAEY